MEIVHVQVRVKDECIEEFKLATTANALQSRREPGVARFEILQQRDEPSRFVLVEIYRTAGASAAHKETKHYQAWRDAVAPMMADPRSSVKFNELSPADRDAQPKGLEPLPGEARSGRSGVPP